MPSTCLFRHTARDEYSTSCSTCGAAFEAWIPEAAADDAMAAGALPTADVVDRDLRPGGGRAVLARISRDLGAWFLSHGWDVAGGLVRDVLAGRRSS